MILDKTRVVDGQTSFELGCETHKAPSRVPRNQSCLLVNATTRQDFVDPRPAWKQIGLTFTTDELKEAFETGLFQGAGGYNPDTGKSCLVLSIAGHLYRANVFGDGSVQEITLDTPNRSDNRKAWFCQAECFLIVQDGQALPIIYNGATARRSDVYGTSGSVDGHPMCEVPVGTVMEYADERLWVSLPNGLAFVAGDAAYDPTGTVAYDYRDAVLKFTENTFLSEGGAFTVPTNIGRITAMRAIANLDTSLGQGPLLVFTTQGAFSINPPANRDDWKNVAYPIKTVCMMGSGAASQESTLLVNSDVWYRSPVDKDVHSFKVARRNFGVWGNHAQSHEVGRHLGNDNKHLLKYASAALFDDRQLQSCIPVYDRSHGTYFKGLVALDFHPLTSIVEEEGPTWDGMWTGLDILRILTIESEDVTRCFAVVLAQPDANEVRRIQIWELTTEPRWNESADGEKQRTEVIIESPRFDFKDRLRQKLLEGADIWVADLSGVVDFYLYYRPDEYPCWFFWKHWQVCSKFQRCSTDAVDGCLSGLNLRPQYRSRMSAQRPADECIPFTNSPSRLGFAFQYRLEIKGQARVTAVRLLALEVLESTFGACLPEDSACEELVCCDENNLVGQLTGDEGTNLYGGSSNGDGSGGNGGNGDGNGNGNGGNVDGGAGSPDEDTNPVPTPTYPSDGGYPLYEGLPSGWENGGVFISGYGITKTSDSPGDDLTYAKSIFWGDLIESEWEDRIGNDTPTTWSERYLAWDYVDPNSTNISDFEAKYATGNSNSNHGLDDVMFSPGAYWRLIFVYR